MLLSALERPVRSLSVLQQHRHDAFAANPRHQHSDMAPLQQLWATVHHPSLRADSKQVVHSINTCRPSSRTKSSTGSKNARRPAPCRPTSLTSLKNRSLRSRIGSATRQADAVVGSLLSVALIQCNQDAVKLAQPRYMRGRSSACIDCDVLHWPQDRWDWSRRAPCRHGRRIPNWQAAARLRAATRTFTRAAA